MARQTAVASVLLALCSMIGWFVAGGVTPAAARACPTPLTPAAELSLDEFDAAVFCLVNEQRVGHGRPALRFNPLLQRAALDYASSMQAGRFFSHDGDFAGHSTGSTPVQRLRQIGYIRRSDHWIVGENLHWATADHSTPMETVLAWMFSPVHRQYLLKARFRELGVAAVRGVPYDAGQTDGIIVASEYGFRDR